MRRRMAPWLTTWNPNGSLNGIAGICNEQRNVVGMMPHPERACEAILGGTDGLVILQSVVAAVQSGGSLAARELLPRS